jgi:exopolyphosphatase/guanosine-5'-triphosphate,3'-diphosphate pyrophosphatase
MNPIETQPARVLYAVIDVGTNSVKLTVGSVARGSVRTAHTARVPARLGAGLARSGRIHEAAVVRAAAAVRRLVADARAHDAREVVVVGTHAFRAAKNGSHAARAIARAAGVDVGVLTGTQEAGYAFASARARLRDAAQRYLIVADVGGGSAQVVFGHGPNALAAHSLPLGAVVLTERFLRHDPVEPAEYRRMNESIDHALASLFARRPRLPTDGFDLVVSGGAATTAAAMLGVWSGAAATRLPLRRLKQLEADCLAATIAQRRRFPGMQPDRADILPAGLAVLLALARHAQRPSVVIVEGGWREGVILERAQQARRSPAQTRSRAHRTAAARRGR